MPPAFLKDQWLLVRVDGSERVSCGRVEDATWRAHAGVVVPTPTSVLAPPLGYIALVNGPVDVAHLLSGVLPLHEPEITKPEEFVPRQLCVPTPRYRAEVDAVVAKSVVVVALVVVLLLDTKP